MMLSDATATQFRENMLYYLRLVFGSEEKAMEAYKAAQDIAAQSPNHFEVAMHQAVRVLVKNANRTPG